MKKYLLEVEEIDGRLNIKQSPEGFTCIEVIGILELAKHVMLNNTEEK